MKLRPKDLFEQKTLADLAHISRNRHSEQPSVVAKNLDDLPLTPIQRWFFERLNENGRRWSLAAALRTRQGLKIDLLEKAIGRVIVSHDALRLRFERSRAGWRQVQRSQLTDFRLNIVNSHASVSCASIAANHHAWVDLSEDELFQATLLVDPTEGRQYLVLQAHHLQLDVSSWPIVLAEIDRAYRALENDCEPSHDGGTSSFSTWATFLMSLVHDAAIREQVDFWRRLPWTNVKRLPLNVGLSSVNAAEKVGRLSRTIFEDKTQVIARDLVSIYRMDIGEIVFTALASAFVAHAGSRTIAVDWEGTGRDALWPGDLSRSIGWFTTLYPVVVDLADVWEMPDVALAIKRVLPKFPIRVWDIERFVSSMSLLLQGERCKICQSRKLITFISAMQTEALARIAYSTKSSVLAVVSTRKDP